MDPRLYRYVCPGRVVNIQRSNGLIHKATVKEVNVQQSAVSVEWCEAGVVKGKEIDIDDIITVNPELAEELPATEVKENFPLQENVTLQKQKRRSTLSKIPAPREGEKTSFCYIPVKLGSATVAVILQFSAV
ncbi:kinesin-like protein KIF2C [Excalfactoria chinensis]|uniref:kinesin-like protein KIF2C n=1 Tax=Excalfactoria chinensis TaxID=46218 RepID=UPI003B3A59A2